jgi:hypothetical protein
MVALDQVAHERTVRATLPEMAAHVESVFGRRLTAAMLGIADPKAVGRYARGSQKPQAEVERTLRAIYQITVLIGQVESDQAIRAWFLGMNPHLDDHAPAGLVRDEPEQVMQAARLFVANG